MASGGMSSRWMTAPGLKPRHDHREDEENEVGVVLACGTGRFSTLVDSIQIGSHRGLTDSQCLSDFFALPTLQQKLGGARQPGREFEFPHHPRPDLGVERQRGMGEMGRRFEST